MTERWLVIDDSSTIQRVIKLAFQDYDVFMTEADSCLEASRDMQRLAPTLVIADAAVTGAQSVQDFVNLRNLAPQIPFIILEGSYDNIDESQFRGAGFLHFLKKPFDAAELLAVTRTALGRALPLRNAGTATVPPPPMARPAAKIELEDTAHPQSAAPHGFDLGLNEKKSSGHQSADSWATVSPAPFPAQAPQAMPSPYAPGPQAAPNPYAAVAPLPAAHYAPGPQPAPASYAPGPQPAPGPNMQGPQSASGPYAVPNGPGPYAASPLQAATGPSTGPALQAAPGPQAFAPAASYQYGEPVQQIPVGQPRPAPAPFPQATESRASNGRSPLSFSLEDEPEPEIRSASLSWDSGERSSPHNVHSLLEPLLKEEMERWVRGAVEDYCRKHFAQIAREMIGRELERLTQERSRLLAEK